MQPRITSSGPMRNHSELVRGEGSDTGGAVAAARLRSCIVTTSRSSLSEIGWSIVRKARILVILSALSHMFPECRSRDGVMNCAMRSARTISPSSATRPAALGGGSHVRSTCSSTSESVRLAQPATSLRTRISTTLTILVVPPSLVVFSTAKSADTSCSGRCAPEADAVQTMSSRVTLERRELSKESTSSSVSATTRRLPAKKTSKESCAAVFACSASR